MTWRTEYVLVVDDLYSSEEDFWGANSEERATFDASLSLKVYPYRSQRTFDEQMPDILDFLRIHAPQTHVLLLDMRFMPDDPRGGLKILKEMAAQKIDIPQVVIASVEDDQSLAIELQGYPFVHRHKTVQLGAILGSIGEYAIRHSLNHPRIGVLISHGTDTLAYVLEFLRLGLQEGLRRRRDINIIVTGSQLSPGEGVVSDAGDNVRTAVLLLRYLYAPQIGAVFNRGECFFEANLQKLHKFDPIAFSGEIGVIADWDRFKSVSDRVRVCLNPGQLEELHVVRTGGTIESVKIQGRGYVPAGDFVAGFITSNLDDTYKHFRVYKNDPPMDSSNMAYPQWIALLKYLGNSLELNVDTHFDERVGVIYANPFATTEDYLAQMQRYRGVVIAGYGAGNGNVTSENINNGPTYSLLSACRMYGEAHPIVMASQVCGGIADPVYETGKLFIESGCVPAGHLSVQAAQVRLSWVLGHILDGEPNFHREVAVAFSEAVRFRTEETRLLWLDLLRKQ